jgi:hypothetical protein
MNDKQMQSDVVVGSTALLGRIGYFVDSVGRICFAEVKKDPQQRRGKLRVLFQRWPETEKYDGYINARDFRVLPNKANIPTC